MRKSLIFLFVGLAILVGIQDFNNKKKRQQTPTPRPYVILLSIDGFRWDYQQKADTPTLDSVTKYGVKALGLQPCFPSLSLPNQYSIITGLHPSNHGIISDNFYNRKLKKYFSPKDKASLKTSGFYKGEPIWVTAEAQNIKTGAYNWVGSNTKIKGYKPTYTNIFNSNLPNKQVVDTIINWLQLPYKRRPKLITWSINDIYNKSSTYGPKSSEVLLSIATIDSLIGNFLTQANSLNITDSLNLIIVSTSGMMDVNLQKTVFVNNILNKTWIDTILGNNAFLQIYPHKKCSDSIIDILNSTKGISAWAKSNTPNKFNIKQSSRLADIIAVADSGWNISNSLTKTPTNKGICGYDNTQKSMNGVFYAIGPNFKQNYNAGQLYNVDIYNLISNILDIKPAPNDGKIERIINILK